MAEYIERDEAIRKAQDACIKIVFRVLRQGITQFDAADIVDVMESVPVADVVEVKHGEWIEDGYYDNPCVCSNCGTEAHYVSKFNENFDYDWEENLQSTGYEETREYIRTPYCPNCGAKMDGKDDAE